MDLTKEVHIPKSHSKITTNMKDQGSTPPQTTSSVEMFTHEKYLDDPHDTVLKKTAIDS